MIRTIVFLSFFAGFILNCPAVEVKVSDPDKAGHKTAVVENDFLKVTLSSLGGRITGIIYKPEGRELTWDDGRSEGGACKDQFPPQNYHFRELDYELKVLKQTPAEAVVSLRSIGGSGKWQFVSISKTYILRTGESRIRCELAIRNQAEAIGGVVLGYWSHNFLGTRNEQNTVFIPTESGVKSFTPSPAGNKNFERNLTRGWAAVIGKSGLGAVCLFEYKRVELVYSWFCRDAMPLDTLEWQLRPEKIPAGNSLETWFELGVVSGMPKISGAGAVGCGEIIVPEKVAPNSPNEVRILLEGFAPKKIRLDILIDGKKIMSRELELRTCNPVEIPIRIDSGSAGSRIVSMQVYEHDRYLFDMEKILQVGDKKTTVSFCPREKRIAGVKDEEAWNIDLSEEFVSPHFKWAKPSAGRAVRALFLMPLHGARDIVELSQRMSLDSTFPNILPQLYDMSWRTETNAGHGEDGLDRLSGYFPGTYDIIVIGSEVYPYGSSRVRWDAFPENVRKSILELVKAGAGLVYIDPQGLSGELEEVVSGLLPVSEKLKNTLDFTAAPDFPGTVIRSGFCGKGRVWVIDYPKAGFLSPHPGWGDSAYAASDYTHRFQEYQFAILAKILLLAAGGKEMISAIKIDKNELTVRLNEKGGNLRVEAFDKFSRPQWKMEKIAAEKKLVLPLPPFLNGNNYIHVKLLNKDGKVEDFGFAVAAVKSPCRIKRIQLSKEFYLPGETIAGTVELEGNQDSDIAVETAMVDNLGRKIFSGHGKNFSWRDGNMVVRRHEIVAKLLKNGKEVDEARKYFSVPGAFNVTEHFANMLWTEYHDWPIYSLPWRLDQHTEFGFNLLYSAGPGRISFLKTANTEITGNGFACIPVLYSSRGMLEWRKTHDRKYLERPDCLHNPQVVKRCLDDLEDKLEQVKPFAGRHLFQLGDEMSITWYCEPWDICFSGYCLAEFRKWLKNEYGTLEALNREWDTAFQNWDEVKPMTRIEILTHSSPAPWADHREFMDKTFSDFIDMYQQQIKKKFPQAIVGPTGVGNPPAVYGGNWNFWNMRLCGCVSMYGTARIPLSFNRNERLVMCYRGYDKPQGAQIFSFWEGLFAGQRGTNNWWGPVFIRPDLAPLHARRYFSDLLWELRGGIGDLLFNSEKLNNEVAILHSQDSLRSNFLKSMKNDYFVNELSYAMALEELGLAYRFVSPEEIEKGELKNFKILILPEITALSPKAAGRIEEFIRNGAVAIADYELALQDKHCKNLPAGQLDKIFGIKQTDTGITQVKTFNIDGYEDKDISIKFVGKYVTPDSGRVNGWALTRQNKKVPLLISNNYGKGHAYFLNFCPGYSESGRSAGAREFKRLLLSLSGIKQTIRVSGPGTLPNIMTVRYRNGSNTYLCLLPSPPSGNWEKMTLADLRRQSFKAELKLPEKSYLYDSREGKYLGWSDTFHIELTPGDGKVFAVLPYKVEKIILPVPAEVEKGSCADIQFKVKASNGQPSHHVFLVEVFNPAHENCLHYRRITESSDGTGKIRIPFALNDPAGRWTVKIKDAATGTVENIYVNVIDRK